MTTMVSKSIFLWGLQCRKLVWTAYNAEDRLPPPDAQAQAVFDQGHEVGSIAQKLFTNAIEVDDGITDLEQILRLTQEAAKLRRPLFEAGFSYHGGFAVADILNPVENDVWDIYEVKSSTSSKDVYVTDLAFQAFVISGAGLKLRRCFLLLINPDFIRHGDIDPSKFFVRNDVTAQVAEVSRQIEPRLEEMFTMIRLKDQPDVRIGPQCETPYGCPLHDQCWSFLPPGSVVELYRGCKKGFDLLSRGITTLTDIPNDVKLTPNQQIQRQVARGGRPHVDRAAIRAFLRKLRYPLSLIDFETVASGVPLFDGTKPFQAIPFQFSAHVLRSPEAEPEHHDFLAHGPGDPRRDFMHCLQRVLPEEGTVIGYNVGFEIARLKECREVLPEFQSWVENVERRALDLLAIFRRFAFYDARQRGSCSLKSILTPLTGRTYDGMGIRNGSMASSQFLNTAFGDVNGAERCRVRRELLEYCHMDTWGLVLLLRALMKLVGPSN